MTKDNILKQFDTLRVDRSHYGPALKKPLLLLLICSKLSRDANLKNEFRFEEIRKDLGDLIRRFGGRIGASGPKPEQPFYHLKNDGFWTIHWPKGWSDPGKALIGPLTNFETKATLSTDIYETLTKDPASRAFIVARLMDRWIPRSLHEELIEQLGLDIPLPGVTPNDSNNTNSRSAEFRIGVKRNFRERCAFCRFQARFLDFAFGLESAHIRSLQFNGPDTIDNGLALCRLHHIAFDRGVLSVSAEHKILVSKELIAQDAVSKTLIEALAGQPLADWKDTQPSPEYLGWHRDQVFQG